MWAVTSLHIHKLQNTSNLIIKNTKYIIFMKSYQIGTYTKIQVLFNFSFVVFKCKFM